MAAKPHIHVLVGPSFDPVRGGTPKAKKWLEANVPDDDVLELDLELGGLVVVDFEPLIAKAEAAGITVYRWNEHGLELEEADLEFEDDENAEEEQQEKDEILEGILERFRNPPEPRPAPPGRSRPMHPANVLNDEEYKEMFGEEASS